MTPDPRVHQARKLVVVRFDLDDTRGGDHRDSRWPALN